MHAYAQERLEMAVFVTVADKSIDHYGCNDVWATLHAVSGNRYLKTELQDFCKAGI